MSGSDSFDPEENYPLIYSWTVIVPSGCDPIVIPEPQGPSISFPVDCLGDYSVELVVTDTFECSSEPAVVTVSSGTVCPTADAGKDKSVIQIGTSILLDGSQSWDDDGDDLSYYWAFISRPPGSEAEFDDSSSETPSFVADVHGDYLIELVVNDSWCDSLPASVTVSFDNVKPVAVSCCNQSVVVDQRVSLSGAESHDDNLDPFTYSWNFVSKSPDSLAVISDPNAVETSFTPDVPGEYIISLVVNDGFVDSDPDNVSTMVISQQEACTQILQELINTINALDQSDFKNKNMKKTLVKKVNVTIQKVDQGDYQCAVNKLEHDILGKTNGCALYQAPDRNDWIRNCEAQEQVDPLIMEAIYCLEGLL